MTDIKHDPATGQNYAYNSGQGRWQEVTREEAMAMQRSFAENVVREAGSQAVDLAGGVLEAQFGKIPLGRELDALGLNPLAEAGRQLRTSNDAAQSARMAKTPGAAVSGMLLDPTMLMGGGPGRKAAAALPNSLSGRFIRTGESVVERSRQRGTPTRQQLRSPAGAQVNPSPAQEIKKPIIGDDVLSPEEMELRYGFPTTAGQKKVLTATDPDEFAAARAVDSAEELRSRDYSGGLGTLRQVGETVGVRAKPADYDLIRQQQQQAVNEAVFSEMGEPINFQLTRGNLGKRRREISRDFEDAYKSASAVDPDPLILNNIKSAIAQNGYSDDVVKRLDFYHDRIDAKTNRSGAGASVKPEDLIGIRNELTDEVRRVRGQESHLERSGALSDLIEMLDQAVEGGMSPNVVATLKDARKQWRVVKAVEEAAASTNARGDVNLKSFINSFRRRNRLFKIGYADDEFSRFLDTAHAAMFKEKPSSGTTEGFSAIAGQVADGLIGQIPGMGILR